MRDCGILNTIKPFVGVLLLTLGLSSCGDTAFIAGAQQSLKDGPGFFTIAGKVDIALFVDDTGSMYEAYDSIASQFPGFLDNLEAMGWNYHFVSSPLTQTRPISGLQVLTSKHDGNWEIYGKFKSPYPGASPGDVGVSIDPYFFTLPGSFSQFVSLNEVSNDNNRYEPGFKNMKNFLTAQIPYGPTTPVVVDSGFLRPDATLVILVFSNGNDSSDVSFCDRGDGFPVPCSGQEATSLNTYRNYFKSLETSGLTKKVRMYSAVANQRQTCLGGISYTGYQYKNMALSLDGANFDICNQSINSTLDGIASKIEDIKISYRQRYVVLDKEPKVETIKLVKYKNGDAGSSEEIKEDAINGWTYVGKTTQYLIDHPIAMNQATGYMLELHGNAKLVGNDAAQVTFQPAGTQNTSTKQ